MWPQTVAMKQAHAHSENKENASRGASESCLTVHFGFQSSRKNGASRDSVDSSLVTRNNLQIIYHRDEVLVARNCKTRFI